MSLAQLSQLLPLPEDDLRQILDYTATLSKVEAASHLRDLLGDSPLAVDFISSFNSKSNAPQAGSGSKQGPGQKKKQVGPSRKGKDVNSQVVSAPTSNHASRSATPTMPQKHASAAGYLISDGPSKAKSNPSSRSSTPKPSTSKGTKVSIAGGTPMTGQSTALSDLDAAIRELEMTTNPTSNGGKRNKCNCVATRHALQSAAPNCLSCGKVICIKEGLGPCSFCGSPLLNPDETQAMLRELKDERGRERMAANAAANRRADVSKTPAPFTKPRDGADGPSLEAAAAKAREHRDRLLGFQAQNAQRTTVRDEAADFDVSDALAGTGNMWASPEERARELKRQQKLVREMEWNARPDYEKRKQVVSIDLIGSKVVRRMATMERPATPDEDETEVEADSASRAAVGEGRRGAFSRNPLLGGLARPVFAPAAGAAGPDGDGRDKGWRRVQDDLADGD
ncbi:C2HC5 finger protein [Ophiocordyceps camponoti-floridani]|uniref:C2HC5 finger protein n=1 Tax=Ophiocordyceps camponoti-floridani TaxID=2030778 RepID=A0A8H4QCL4_9HYPO|nr:C2HC5 finger protein [Ophiocordyceps camponoti-floridani]